LETLHLQIFNSAGALADYVTAEGILQTKIVIILQRTGKWHLFWYAV
jgi:hypothetical protein